MLGQLVNSSKLHLEEIIHSGVVVFLTSFQGSFGRAFGKKAGSELPLRKDNKSSKPRISAPVPLVLSPDMVSKGDPGASGLVRKGFYVKEPGGFQRSRSLVINIDSSGRIVRRTGEARSAVSRSGVGANADGGEQKVKRQGSCHVYTQSKHASVSAGRSITQTDDGGIATTTTAVPHSTLEQGVSNSKVPLKSNRSVGAGVAKDCPTSTTKSSSKTVNTHTNAVNVKQENNKEQKIRRGNPYSHQEKNSQHDKQTPATVNPSRAMKLKGSNAEIKGTGKPTLLPQQNVTPPNKNMKPNKNIPQSLGVSKHKQTTQVCNILKTQSISDTEPPKKPFSQSKLAYDTRGRDFKKASTKLQEPTCQSSNSKDGDRIFKHKFSDAENDHKPGTLEKTMCEEPQREALSKTQSGSASQQGKGPNKVLSKPQAGADRDDGEMSKENLSYDDKMLLKSTSV